jgi:hypothetical protein
MQMSRKHCLARGRKNPGGEGGILLPNLPHPLKSLVRQCFHLNYTPSFSGKFGDFSGFVLQLQQ